MTKKIDSKERVVKECSQTHHHQQMLHNFKIRFFVSSILTIPLLIIAGDMIPQLRTTLYPIIPLPLLTASLATMIFFYGGWPFLKGFLSEITTYKPGMMTLIFLATALAYSYSIAIIFGLKGKPFFMELATLLDIMLFGHWLEMKATLNASRSLTSFMEFMPKTAHLIMDRETKEVAIDEIQVGNLVLVKPGEKIPLDGTIIEGLSTINQAALTGESKPIVKTIGEFVLGGSLNEEGSLTIRVDKLSSQSYFAQVIKLVEQTIARTSPLQNLTDRVAQWLTLIALTAGGLTFYIWYTLQPDVHYALERAVTVMIIACPHALVLAVPLVVAVITTLAAHNGFLIRNKAGFEQCYNANMVLFDKTGTLTQGSLGVTDIVTLSSWSKDELISNVAALEAKCEHPIAQNIVQLAHEKKLILPHVSDFKALVGRGIQGILNNRELLIGHKNILSLMSPAGKATHHNAIAETITRANKIEQEGKTVIVVVYDNNIYGLIGLRDTIRKKSSGAIRTLNSLGMQTAMITGDNRSTAQKVAEQLGIQIVLAEIMPDQKAAEIKKLQDQGVKVIMVGDGINDAPALVQADVGIALSTGTDIAIDSADIILVHNDLSSIIDIIKLSRISRRTMLQNIAWATGYNIIAIPLAAGILYPFGIEIHPALGAIAMSVSTIIVTINSARISFRRTQDL